MSLPVSNNLTIWQNLSQDWQPMRLKYIARFAYGDSLPSEQREEGNIPVFGSNGIVGYHNLANTLAPTIIVGRKGSFGKVTYSEQAGFAIDTTYFIDSRYTKEHLRWLYYALQTLGLGDFSQDTGVPGLAREKAYEFYLNVPPYNLQQAIASFLDRKTAAIATLIAKKQRLIQLLEEKRTALINQAVTKGLNPNVLMRKSHIPWIGEIPEHWKIKRIKFVCRLETGHTPSRTEKDYWVEKECIIPWVSLNDTKTLATSDYISETKHKISSLGMANSSAHLIESGAVVFTRDATIGLAAITTKPMAVSQHIIAWVCLPVVDNQFLLNVIYAMKDELERLTMGSTLKTIGMPDIKELKMPVPSLEEQIMIINQLNKDKQKIKEITANITQQIEKLQEYRQSLITAAVTGKINIREEVTA